MRNNMNKTMFDVYYQALSDLPNKENIKKSNDKAPP